MGVKEKERGVYIQEEKPLEQREKIQHTERKLNEEQREGGREEKKQHGD